MPREVSGNEHASDASAVQSLLVLAMYVLSEPLFGQ